MHRLTGFNAPILHLTLFAMATLSAITFAVYGWDKSAARKKAPRVSERTLHLLAALGGWPGAYLGQRVFRHKTVKVSFRRIFWLTLLPPLVILGAVIWA